MGATRFVALACGTAVVVGSFTGLPATAAAKTSVAPTGLSWVEGVSHTGRWLFSGDGVILDRITGQTTQGPSEGAYFGNPLEFVRDNPALHLERQPEVPVFDAAGVRIGHRTGPVWLTNTATGARTRIDTDSSGTPLEPTWAGMPGNDLGDLEDPWESRYPNVVVSATSVSRNGTLVAFCANFEVNNQFKLYLKDVSTGALTKRAEECGAGGPEPGGEYVRLEAPEVSHDGRVVHLRGAVYTEDYTDGAARFYRDTLVFPGGEKRSRLVPGNGTMTRDGKLIFLRKGERAVGERDRTGGKVGIYTISSGRTKTLRGRNKIYGNDPLWFSAFDKASWRGRYVVYGNRAAVIDRKKGRVYDYGKVMRRHGYSPNRITTNRSGVEGPYISGDAKVIFAESGGKYVAVDWR